jgi:hypothetical protein
LISEEEHLRIHHHTLKGINKQDTGDLPEKERRSMKKARSARRRRGRKRNIPLVLEVKIKATD